MTVLFNDQNPPAGSVDEFGTTLISSVILALPPKSSKPAAFQSNPQENPGVGGAGFPGQVYGIAALTNNEALFIGGDFPSYDGATLSGVALINTNGLLDTSFNTGTGVSGDLTQQGNDAKVNAVAVSGQCQAYIGGNFTSYNGQTTVGIARLNANGSLDTSFQPQFTSRWRGAYHSGFRRAVKILIGGDFTHVDNVARNYVAQLNADGSLDTTFDPVSTLNGPVYAIAQPVPPVSFNNSAANSTSEVDQPVNFGVANAGALTLDYDMEGFTNEIQVYYGGNNATAPGTGVLNSLRYRPNYRCRSFEPCREARPEA